MWTWNQLKRGSRNTSMMLRWISVLMNCMLLRTIDLFWIFDYAKYNLMIVCFDSGIFPGQMMFKLMLQVGLHCFYPLLYASFISSFILYSFLHGLFSKSFLTPAELSSTIAPSRQENAVQMQVPRTTRNIIIKGLTFFLA